MPSRFTPSARRSAGTRVLSPFNSQNATKQRNTSHAHAYRSTPLLVHYLLLLLLLLQRRNIPCNAFN